MTIENIKSAQENKFKRQISNFDIGRRPRVQSNHKDRYYARKKTISTPNGSKKHTMILALMKHSLQDPQASDIIIDGKNTHSNRKLISLVIKYWLNSHLLKKSSNLEAFLLWAWKTPESIQSKKTRRWTNGLYEGRCD